MSAMGVLSGHVLLTMSFVGRDPNRVQKDIVKFNADQWKAYALHFGSHVPAVF